MPSSANVLGRPAPTRGGDWPVTNDFTVTAAQTFKVGDWVYLDGSGTLAVCCTTGNNCAGGVLPLGRACADAVDCLALGTPCPVEVPPPNGEFLVQLQHDTPGSAIITVADLDAPYTLPLGLIGSTWVADVESNGSEDRVVVVTIDREFPPSTEYGYVWVRLLLGQQEWQAAT